MIASSASDKRLASTGYYLANKDFALKYPTVLAAVLDEIGSITVKAGESRDELAAVAADATGIDLPVWKATFARTEFTLGPVTDADVARQQQLADTFLSLGIIPQKIHVADIVWRAPATP